MLYHVLHPFKFGSYLHDTTHTHTHIYIYIYIISKFKYVKRKKNPKNSTSLISKYNRSKHHTSNPIKTQNQEEKKTFHFNHAKPPKLVQEPKSRQTSPKLVKKRSNIATGMRLQKLARKNHFLMSTISLKGGCSCTDPQKR